MPGLAYANPFCIDVKGMQPQCDYVDAAECRKRAGELHASCSANATELTAIEGNGHVCIVDSTRIARCLYSDRGSCEEEAARSDAICIDNPLASGR